MTLTPLAAAIGYLFYFSGHLMFGVVVMPVYFLLAPFQGLSRRFLYAVFRWYVFFLSRRYLPFLGVYRVRRSRGWSGRGRRSRPSTSSTTAAAWTAR